MSPNTPLTPLKLIREKSGISQARLAEMVGSSQPQIRRLELGQRKMTTQWAQRLAPALRCHWLELLGVPAPADPEEETLLYHLRELSEDDRATVYRITDALARKTESARKVEEASASEREDDRESERRPVRVTGS